VSIVPVVMASVPSFNDNNEWNLAQAVYITTEMVPAFIVCIVLADALLRISRH
jgi:hypothetical protein